VKLESVEVDAQETGISWMRGDETALVSVSDRTVMTRLDRAGWRGEVEPSGLYKNYRLPVAAIFRPRNRAAFERGPSPAQQASGRLAAEKASRARAQRQASKRAAS